jgi:hypothetical protein
LLPLLLLLLPLTRRTSNLEELQLGSNFLTGPVPPQLGLLKKINVVNLAQNPALDCLLPGQRSTSSSSAASAEGRLTSGLVGSTGSGAIKLADGMYAVPLRASEPKPYCSDEQLLPCFLYFANYTVPRADNSKMACPAILRRHIEEARSMCAGDGPGQLGSQSHNVADALAADEQSWKIEPGYYHYRGCRCFSVSVAAAACMLGLACWQLFCSAAGRRLQHHKHLPPASTGSLSTANMPVAACAILLCRAA